MGLVFSDMASFAFESELRPLTPGSDARGPTSPAPSIARNESGCFWKLFLLLFR